MHIKWSQILNSGYFEYSNSHSHKCLTEYSKVMEAEKIILFEWTCHVHCNTLSSSLYCIDRNVHTQAEQIKMSQVNCWEPMVSTFKFYVCWILLGCLFPHRSKSSVY